MILKSGVYKSKDGAFGEHFAVPRLVRVEAGETGEVVVAEGEQAVLLIFPRTLLEGDHHLFTSDPEPGEGPL